MKSSIEIDYRCSCGKLLFRGMIFRSCVEVKCPRCNKLNFFEGIGMSGNSNRFIVLSTLKGKIVNVSHSIEQILGSEAKDLLDKNIEKIWVDRQTADSDRIFAQKVVGRKYLRFDGECQNKRGERIPVSICYRHFLHNGGELLLRIIDAVSEPDKRLLDGAKFDPVFYCDVVTETDEDGTIIYIDRNLEKILGFKPEDLIGMKVDDLLFGEEKEMRSKNYKMLRAKKKAYRTIPGFKVKGKNGEIYEQEVFCTPFYDDGGSFIGFRNMHWLKKLDVDN